MISREAWYKESNEREWRRLVRDFIERPVEELALEVLAYMQRHQPPFDPKVFNALSKPFNIVAVQKFNELTSGCWSASYQAHRYTSRQQFSAHIFLRCYPTANIALFAGFHAFVSDFQYGDVRRIEDLPVRFLDGDDILHREDGSDWRDAWFEKDKAYTISEIVEECRAWARESAGWDD